MVSNPICALDRATNADQLIPDRRAGGDADVLRPLSLYSRLSSITKNIDSSKNSTLLYALLRSKHVSNVFDGPPCRLLCVRYAYISSNTPAICLSIARVLHCVSLF